MVMQEAILNHLKKVSQYTQYDRESLFDVLATQQIPNISVDKLLAGTITVDNIFVGGPGLELDGLLQQLIVSDDTPVVRVEVGRFGAGAAYGIKGYMSDGTLFFQISDTVFIRTAASGQRVVLDNTGLEAYNASGIKTVDINSNGTFVLQGATSGARINISELGFLAFNSGGTQTVSINSDGTA